MEQGENFRGCKCRKHLRWSHAGKQFRHATKTRSWEQAEKIKRQVEASLVLSSEEPLQQAMLLGQYETIASEERIPADSRGYRYLDALLNQVAAVTIEEIARVAREYFVEDNRTVGYLINDPDSREHHRAA